MRCSKLFKLSREEFRGCSRKYIEIKKAASLPQYQQRCVGHAMSASARARDAPQKEFALSVVRHACMFCPPKRGNESGENASQRGQTQAPRTASRLLNDSLLGNHSAGPEACIPGISFDSRQLNIFVLDAEFVLPQCTDPAPLQVGIVLICALSRWSCHLCQAATTSTQTQRCVSCRLPTPR